MSQLYFALGWSSLVTLLAIRKFSPEIYDIVIVRMTRVWYKAVLERLEVNSRVLDIGIGTGTALAQNYDLITQRNLQIVGVDYESVYVSKCEKVMKSCQLQNHVFVVWKSVYDEDLLSVSNSKCQAADVSLRFDAVYFSGSISLMPDPALALKTMAETMLTPTGKVYITQTFQKRGNKWMEYAKPWLKYLTTIDFGKLTYVEEVTAYIKESGLELVEQSVIPNSIDNSYQAAYLIVLQRKN